MFTLPSNSSFSCPQSPLRVPAPESFLEVVGGRAFVPYLLQGRSGPLEKSFGGWMTWPGTWGYRPFLPVLRGQEEGPSPQRGCARAGPATLPRK